MVILWERRRKKRGGGKRGGKRGRKKRMFTERNKKNQMIHPRPQGHLHHDRDTYSMTGGSYPLYISQ